MMPEKSIEGTILEKRVGLVTVRIAARSDETPADVYERLNYVCNEIETRQVLEGPIARIRAHFSMTDDDLTKTGINNDYHRVMLSLIFNLNHCMGATDISNEWGGINTGNVSRVFTGSKKSTEKYKGHFEKCKGGGYRFTEIGLKYALEKGLSEILGP